MFGHAMLLAAAAFHPPPSAASASVTASFVIRLPAGTSTYHMGEEIPLELVFRGLADADYYFSTAACGFFGRFIWPEKLAITPSDGIDDPLGDLFASTGYAGSCLSSWQPLDDTPLVIRVSLNDAVRFNRPGAYHIVVSTTRMGRYSRQPAPILTSAPVDLTITPMDVGWSAAEIDRANGLVDSGSAASVKHGAAILRDLGTEAAALALIDRYDEIAKVDANEVVAGLTSSLHRALIIQRMEVRVDEGASLDKGFLSTLARLRVLLEMLPSVGDAPLRAKRTALVQAEYEARWRAAIARKPASAATFGAELARFETSASAEVQQQIAQELERHPKEAIEAFVALPADTQQGILRSASTWRHLDRPWILPALRRTYVEWHGRADQGDLPGAGDIALMRLYELAPEEGRRLILEEIQTGLHQIRYEALAILPDPERPEMDAALQARYSAGPARDAHADSLVDRGTTAWLIARYGSSRMNGFVNALLARTVPGCVVEAGLIAYLLKHDAPAAMKRLDPGVGRTSGNGCVIPPLSQLAARYWDDRLESAVIDQLMGFDIPRVIAAAEVLGSRGSRAAKQALIDRLTSWSAEWHDRAVALMALKPTRRPSPAMVEYSIANALFQNPEFGLTRDDAAMIRALCVTDGCRTNVDARASGIR